MDGRRATASWWVLTGTAALGVVAGLHAQPAAAVDAAPPFAVGERLTYRLDVGRMGTVGRGEMWVEGPEGVRGTDVYRLRFDLTAKKGLVKAVDRTESWLDPKRMAALRFHKQERHPLSRHDERVELFPAERRWVEAGGRAGTSPTDAPLDELSFIYFLRTVPLAAGDVHEFNRHFEAERNPTTVRVLGTETIETAAGTFRTLLVEMRVRDPRRYKGEGVIRLSLTDDDRRIPVRIQSRMPVVGATVLTLESVLGARPVVAAAEQPGG